MRWLDVKRLKIIFLLFFLVAGNILLFTSPAVKASVKASPAELVITMPDGYPDDKIQYKIKITNPYSAQMNVKSKIIDPFDLTTNFTNVPDLSWITISPENLCVPPNSYGELEVTIIIPEDEKNKQYNKSWEAWAYLAPKVDGSATNVAIQAQLAIRLYIHTPSGTMTSKTTLTPPNFYILIGIIIGSLVILMISSYLRKKKNIKYNQAAMFYVKKKGNKDRKDKKI